MEDLMDEGEAIPAFLPTLSALEEAIKKGVEWSDKVNSLQKGDNYAYIDHLDTLVTNGRQIPMRLESLPLLESHLQAAKSWRERTARTFLRKNSHYTLMDALSPRVEVGVDALKVKKKRADNLPSTPPLVGSVTLNGKVDPASVVAAFKSAEKEEMSAIVNLRRENLAKRAENHPDSKYCICRQSLAGNMLECELCKDWFHSGCVPQPKGSPIAKQRPKNSNHQAGSPNSKETSKFLCPCCLRSRRPRLETILSLLVSLQKLPVRIPEGEALQCLTERAMNWQDRARQILATKELSGALAKLSVQSQKLVEIAARAKTQKIISSELKKAACNPFLHNRMKALSSQIGLGDCEEELGSPISPDCSSFPRSEPDTGPDDDEIEEEDPIPEAPLQGAFGNTEHAYSSASRVASAPLSGKKHSRKSPLVPRQLEPPPVILSPQSRSRLEELTIEGDLLEVSLDELQLIWRILQSATPQKELKFMDFELEEGDTSSSISPDKPLDVKKKCPKKRSSEQSESATDKRMKRLGKLQSDRTMGQQSPCSPKKKPRNLKEIAIKKIRRTQIKPHAMKKEDFEAEQRERLLYKQMQEKEKVNPYKHRIPKPRLPVVNCSDDSEDEHQVEEDCAADKCLSPTGTQVHWVQCDGGCQQWFHLLCVGLHDGDINDDEDYFCKRCSALLNIMSDDRRTEIATEDESVGLDALLSLAESLPVNDDPLAVPLHEGWSLPEPRQHERFVVDLVDDDLGSLCDQPTTSLFQRCVIFQPSVMQPNH